MYPDTRLRKYNNEIISHCTVQAGRSADPSRYLSVTTCDFGIMMISGT